MKLQKKLLVLLLLIVFTAACSGEKVSNNQPDKTEEITTASKEEPIENDEIVKEEDQVEEEEVDQPTQEEIVQEPQYKINPSNFNVEPIDDAPQNVVLFTIDDAPDKHGLEMAKTLKELNVNAIFFVNGHFLDTPEEKEVLKQIHEMGFQIGNHTMTHQNLKKLSEEEQYKEIVELSNLVESIIGERPKFFRAPFGANTEYSKQLALDEKMILMNWSYGYDFMKDYMTKEAIADIMVNTNLLRDGANLLMHDREWTKDALPDIVKGLQDKGYTIVDTHLIETIK